MILAKSAPTKEQLIGKLNIGIKNIEMHLDDYNFSIKEIQKLFEEERIKKIKVHQIHMPLQDDALLCNMEDINYVRGLERTCFLAQHFSMKQNMSVGVVVHAPSCKLSNSLKEKIKTELERLLDTYTEIYFLVENNSPLRTNPYLHPTAGYLQENIEICKLIQRPNRIYTLLDTCHIYITQEFYNRFAELSTLRPEGIQMIDYIQKNKKYLKAIHLANAEGIGLLPETHGTPLRDREKLEEIFLTLEKINVHPTIVLEVGETNYTVTPNLQCAKASVEQFLMENNLKY